MQLLKQYLPLLGFLCSSSEENLQKNLKIETKTTLLNKKKSKFIAKYKLVSIIISQIIVFSQTEIKFNKNRNGSFTKN